MKNVLIIFGSSVLLIGLLMAGCRALIYTASSSVDCERFNIDGIEVRTGIDIPAITNVDCIYNEGIKNVTFTLDTNKVDINHYLERNNFKKLNDFYLIKGESESTNWHGEYDVTLATLKMKIIYKDILNKS